jgi:malonate-semialdehyde dehydrogenase (acetylating)/methylmalonate-semialdehyde dehydrogenase
LNTKEAKARVEGIINKAEKENKILLDGRNAKVKGYEKGNFIGATVIDHC